MNTTLRLTRFSAAAAVAAVALAACDDDPTDPMGPMDVTIPFGAAVNGAPFTCGQSFPGVGTRGTEITPVDFRLYVHGVELLAADGSATPVDLEDDGVWQRDGLALLDFEDGSGPCTGNGITNTTLRGTVEAGNYTGIRFVLGVPESMNHGDQTLETAPLDVPPLFWSWNAGYKFARLDHISAERPGGWFVHLGSTGCQPVGDPTVPATACANAHRPTVTLTGFDLETDEIVADLGVLLSGVDVTVNEGASGCMSFPGDPECPTVMNAFGLDYEGSISSGQTFFSVR